MPKTPDFSELTFSPQEGETMEEAGIRQGFVPAEPPELPDME